LQKVNIKHSFLLLLVCAASWASAARHGHLSAVSRSGHWVPRLCLPKGAEQSHPTVYNLGW